jgi:hypothetical protein
MATKAPDQTATGPNFASAEYAEQWRRGKRMRGEGSLPRLFRTAPRCRSDAVLTEYPETHHSFDNPLGNKTPTISKSVQTFRGRKLKEEPLGTIIHAESGDRFTRPSQS